MINTAITNETTDVRLLAMHLEIAELEQTFSKHKNAGQNEELKQRLYFLQWKREFLTVTYNYKKTGSKR